MSEDAFDSSDSARDGAPLRHVQHITLDESLALELGGVLPSVTVACETYGTLAPTRSNAVLICHAISGDSHVAKHDESDQPGWWDVLVGPGRPVDTDRFFVICPNVLGGCRGTTGPGSINPRTGQPYGRDFPTITIRDIIEVERRILDHFGIDRLLAIVGGSIGGHQALSWNVHYPDRVRGTVLLATSPRLNSQALAFDVVGRNAILRDPHFHAGQYYDKPEKPIVGLALARMIGHITYLSREAMTEKFEADRLQPREVATEFEKTFSVGSYLGYQGMRFVERFDANSYVTLSLAMDLFDLGATPDKVAAMLSRARSRWLVLSFSSDWLFPPEQSRDIVDALLANAARVSYCNVPSTCGHDAFLLPDDFAIYGEMTRAFLHNIAAEPEDPRPLAAGSASDPLRAERQLAYDRIIELIPPNASVLDLGCGTGRLLARLKENGSRRLVGIELDENKIVGAIRRNLDVIHADLNRGLRAFADQEFDCVVLSQTLQAVQNVQGVIDDMLRVGRACIVSFPNLAYHKLRRILAEDGRAPRSYGWLSDQWYNTRDIRFLSIADFEDFCRDTNVQVDRRITLDTEAGVEVAENPNLNADLAIFVIRRGTRAGARK